MGFDPYHKWLAIPPIEQPPNLYRLLGVNLFEADPDVIEMAADQRMAHVRHFQNGPHSDLSQKILNELAAARVKLLSPDKKAAYDVSLRERFSTPPVFSAPPPLAVPDPAPALAQHSAVAVADPLNFLSDPDFNLTGLVQQSAQPADSASAPAPAASATAPQRPAVRNQRLSPLAIILLSLMPVGAILFTYIVARNSNLGDEEPTRPSVARVIHADPSPTLTPSKSKRDIQPIQRPAPARGAIKPVGVADDPPRRVEPDNKALNPPDVRIIPPIVVQPIQEAPDPPKKEAPADEAKPEPAAPPVESKKTEPIVLNFDQDELRIQVPVGDVPKEAQLQIAIIEPAEKVTESKAKIKAMQHIVLNDEPHVEVTMEVAKSRPGFCVVKISPWLGNRAKGIPCNLSRMQQMASNLPGQIQDAQAAFEGAGSDLASWQSHLQSLLSENHGAPGADPSGQIRQQVAIREAKAKLTAIRGRANTLSRSIDRWTTQLNELPTDIQLVNTLVGTTIRYRLFYVTDEKEIEVGKK